MFYFQSVREMKAPGVEREKNAALSKPSIDLRACYGLVYRQVTVHDPVRLPAAEVSKPWFDEVRWWITFPPFSFEIYI